MLNPVLVGPQAIFRVIIFTFAGEYGAIALSLANFMANGGKQTLINGVYQYGTYVGATP